MTYQLDGQEARPVEVPLDGIWVPGFLEAYRKKVEGVWSG